MTGAELRAFRKQRGWTQRQLGALISQSLGKEWRDGRAMIGSWERGRREVPADVETFLTGIEIEQPGEEGLPFEPTFADSPPPPPPGLEQAAAQVAAVVGAGGYARVCEELWELVATGVGMVGAVTGSEQLRRDGAIIAEDKAALGKAYGKLAEQNATFRNMLAGMTGGGAWLEVALVSGITAGKLMRNHQKPKTDPGQESMGPRPAPEPQPGEPGVMYGDGAVIDLPV